MVQKNRQFHCGTIASRLCLIHCTLLFMLSMACVAPVAPAQNVVTLTPEQTVEISLQEHGLLEQAEAAGREARAAVRQMESARWPRLGTRATYMRLSDNIPSITAEIPGVDTSFTIAPVELNRYHLEINLEQPLFTGTRITNSIRAAERRAEAASERVSQEQANAALQAREAYWSLYRAQRQQEAIEVSLEQVEAHLRNVQVRVDEGAALRSHLLAAQTRRTSVQLDLIEAENDLLAAELELRRLTGLERNLDIALQGDVQLEPVAPSLEELITDALDDHPEINALRGQVDALEAEARVARRAWMPEAALTGRYTYARPNQYFFAEQDRFRPSWEAGVVVRWDLWEGGRRGAERDQAEARVAGERAQLEYALDQIEMDITRRYQAVRGMRQTLGVAEDAVREAEESFRVVTQHFEAGAALSSDVLEAEAALQSARARQAEAISSYAIARAALLQALGRVW